MSGTYWGLAPTDQIASEIKTKWQSYHHWLQSSGLAAIIQECYSAYYSFTDGGFGVVKSQDGSEASVKIQHLKSIIQRIHSLVTQAKLAYDCKSTKSDSSAMVTSDFARGLLEYIGERKNMNATVSDMVEKGLICLDSYVYSPWNFRLGQQIRDGHFTGDQDFKVLTRFDVASHTRNPNSPYFIIRETVNKFDLQVQYPQHADAIKSAGSKNLNEYILTPMDSNQDDDEDDIEIFTLIHDKTLALPLGRLTVICGDTVLDDVANPYREMPITHFQPGKIQETVAGDSPITSQISIQQVIDRLWSATSTNSLQYSKINVWSPSAVQMEPLSEGYNNIISAQKPEALILANQSDGTANLIQALQQQQQILSGMGNVARSNPEASLKTGVSIALMLAIAIQHTDDVQKAYAAAAGQIATIVISNHQQFQTEAMLAEIGGQSRKSVVKEFTAKDLEGIRRIAVSIGNPLTQNVAGRYEVLTNMLNAGIIKDPAKMIEFIRTGEMDSLTEDQFKDSILIRSENEMMMRGESPIVLATDIHPQHILEHKNLANDPETRKNPQLMEVLNQHQLDHINAMKTLDPDIASVLGIAPLPSQSMGAVPQPQGPDGQKVELPPNGPGEPPVEQRLPEVPDSTPPMFKGRI